MHNHPTWERFVASSVICCVLLHKHLLICVWVMIYWYLIFVREHEIYNITFQSISVRVPIKFICQRSRTLPFRLWSSTPFIHHPPTLILFCYCTSSSFWIVFVTNAFDILLQHAIFCIKLNGEFLKRKLYILYIILS